MAVRTQRTEGADLAGESRFGVEPRGSGVGGESTESAQHGVDAVAGQVRELLAEGFTRLVEPPREDGVGHQHRGHRGEAAEVAVQARVLREHRTQPGRSRGRHEVQRRLDRQHRAELADERRLPVVPVGQCEHLAVVPHLEELLRRTMPGAGADLGVGDRVAGESADDLHQPAAARMVRPEVQVHAIRRGDAQRRPQDVRGHRWKSDDARTTSSGENLTCLTVSVSRRSAAFQPMSCIGCRTEVKGVRSSLMIGTSS